MEKYERKYKNALEHAKQELESCESQDCDAARQIFRLFLELQKSEDEKNIKNLIDELKLSLRAANCQNDACGGGQEKRIALLEWGIAWIEKQVDKVEPKFKSGDFIADGRRTFLVLANKEERNLGETYSTYCEGLVLNVYGDVLVNDKDFSGFRLATDIERANFVHDLKVGTKINSKTSEWSKEDERMKQAIFETIIHYTTPDGLRQYDDFCGEELISEMLNWLKSLKERMKGETK